MSDVLSAARHYFHEGRCSNHAQFNGRYCRDAGPWEQWCIHCAGLRLLELATSDPARVQSVEPAPQIGSATNPSCLSCRRLEGERDEIRAVLDKWVPLGACETKPLAQRIDDELSDYFGMMDEVSKAYDTLTASRISKPNTLAACVISEVEELQSRDIDDAVKEAEAALTTAQRERDEWKGKATDWRVTAHARIAALEIVVRRVAAFSKLTVDPDVVDFGLIDVARALAASPDPIRETNDDDVGSPGSTATKGL